MLKNKEGVGGREKNKTKQWEYDMEKKEKEEKKKFNGSDELSIIIISYNMECLSLAYNLMFLGRLPPKLIYL